MGRVMFPGGKAKSRAEIFLYSKPLLDIPELGGVHLVRVKADENGKFKARIELGRKYKAWAEYTGLNGSKHFSKIVDGVAKLRALYLVESNLHHIPIDLVLHGLESWQALGPLQFQWVSESAGGYGTKIQVVKNKAKLQPLPGNYAYLRILDKDGMLILEHGIYQNEQHRKNRLKRKIALRDKLPNEMKILAGLSDPRSIDWTALNVEHVLIPPPMQVRFKLVDEQSQKPITAGEVVYRHRYSTNPQEEIVRKSDKDGFVEFTVPRPMDIWGRHRTNQDLMTFLVRTKGYSLQRFGWPKRNRPNIGMKPLLAHEVKNGKAPELTVSVKKGRTIRGKITLDGKKPIEGIAIIYDQQGFDRSKDGRSASSFQAIVQIHRSRKDGSFLIPGLYANDNHDASLALVLPPRMVPELLGEKLHGAPVHPRILLYAQRINNPDKDVVLPTIDLSRLRCISLTAHLPNGDPAAFANVDVRSNPNSGNYYLSPFFKEMYRCDHRGRLSILSFDRLSGLVLLGDEHYLFIDSLAANNPNSDGRDPYSFTLKPMECIQGKVLDKTGQAIPEARFEIHDESISNSGSKFTEIANDINEKLLSKPCETNGFFKLHFIPHRDLRFFLRATVSIGGHSVYSNETINVRQESQKDLVITIPVDYAKEKNSK